MSPTSIFSREKLKIGSTYFSWNWPNAPAAFGRPSWFQTQARYPAAIDPPETLDIRVTRDKIPSSLSRSNAPAWNSMARKPPPDRASAIPGSRELPSHLNLSDSSAMWLGEEGRAPAMVRASWEKRTRLPVQFTI